ncbi:MAG: hypothetical protein ACIAQF_05940, partial [Phycisphaerales bacterium JB065]
AVRTQIELERLRLELTMIRVQTKALETLERLMDDPEPTGNEKQDRFEATKRNRQRLAANQVLIHCRTAAREKRLAQAKQRLEPNRASDGSQTSEKEMPDPPSPLEGRPEPSDHPDSSGATGGSPASAGPDQPEPRPDHSTPTPPQHWPTSAQWHTITKPKRSRYKVRKPKHPRRSRKRKRAKR